jgi:hypothetical protein
MLVVLLIWATSCIPLLNAIPTTQSSVPTVHKNCNNILQDASFETGLSPWLDIGFGAWDQRGVMTSSEGGHHGQNFYYGQSKAVLSNTTFTLSQSALTITAGTTVNCSAWVASKRPGNVGSTSVELFIDEASCGGPVYYGTNPWQKIGGQVTVSQDSHTFSIVVISDVTGPEGSETWVDDAVVGTSC